MLWRQQMSQLARRILTASLCLPLGDVSIRYACQVIKVKKKKKKIFLKKEQKKSLNEPFEKKFCIFKYFVLFYLVGNTFLEKNSKNNVIHTQRELISARKTPHEHNKKDRSRLR